jgi:hypothetical protein
MVDVMAKRERSRFRDELARLMEIDDDESLEFAAQDARLTAAGTALGRVERWWVHATSRSLRLVDGRP